jgi:acylglycerol lipase
LPAIEDTFRAADGTRLFERRWQPAEPARAVVVVVHGLAEHGGRYTRVAQHLVRAGYAVLAPDLRGHGRSEGPRARVRSFDQFLDDLELSLGRAREWMPGRQLFLLGHSMGGTTLTLLMLTRQPEVAGLILTGAVLTPGKDVSPATLMLAKLLGRLVPTVPLQRVNSAAVSRDPAVVAAYDADPLNWHGGTQAGMAGAFLDAIERSVARLEALNVPLLILHGGADALSDAAGSRALHARARSTDKTLRVYDGLYHEILNEPEQNQVLADITAWLDARV